MTDTLLRLIEARQAQRVEKYRALLPEDLAREIASIHRQLENARTGLLRITPETPPVLTLRFALLVALAGEDIAFLDRKTLPDHLRDAIALGRVLGQRFGADSEHVRAIVLDTDTWEEALALAQSAVGDLDPEADAAARDLDLALREEGLLQGSVPEQTPPSPPELKGNPPEVPSFFAELAKMCSGVLDEAQCKILASGSFSWPALPQPPEEVLADRLARLFLKQKKVKDPEGFLAERGYIAPEGRLPL